MKKKRKARAPKVRKSWGKLKPASRVVKSKKTYERGREKAEVRKWTIQVLE